MSAVWQKNCPYQSSTEKYLYSWYLTSVINVLWLWSTYTRTNREGKGHSHRKGNTLHRRKRTPMNAETIVSLYWFFWDSSDVDDQFLVSLMLVVLLESWWFDDERKSCYNLSSQFVDVIWYWDMMKVSPVAYLCPLVILRFEKCDFLLFSFPKYYVENQIYITSSCVILLCFQKEHLKFVMKADGYPWECTT